MVYEVLLSKQVKKFLDGLSDDYILKIQTKVLKLAENPYSRNLNLDILPLIGKPKGSFEFELAELDFYTKFKRIWS